MEALGWWEKSGTVHASLVGVVMHSNVHRGDVRLGT